MGGPSASEVTLLLKETTVLSQHRPPDLHGTPEAENCPAVADSHPHEPHEAMKPRTAADAECLLARALLVTLLALIARSHCASHTASCAAADSPSAGSSTSFRSRNDPRTSQQLRRLRRPEWAGSDCSQEERCRQRSVLDSKPGKTCTLKATQIVHTWPQPDPWGSALHRIDALACPHA